MINSQTKTREGAAVLVIPVLDMMQGQVVAADGGARDRYSPLHSPLCPSSDPKKLLEALLTLFPFSTTYIADLDAIRGCGDQFQAIARLTAPYQQLRFWVDAGIASAAEMQRWATLTNVTAVIGSENQHSLRAAAFLLRRARTAILSLDFRDGDFLGPPELLHEARLWPPRVIGMSLHRVGSGYGPDFERLHALRRSAPQPQLFAAGGIRDHRDLVALQELGIQGALCATALHKKRLDARELQALCNGNPSNSYPGMCRGN
ncbi:MAG: HisA/HisF-related TIM barrel protein [Gammaproteobacteria bacterium]